MGRNYGGCIPHWMRPVPPTHEEQVSNAQLEAMGRLLAARSRFSEATTDAEIDAAILAVRSAEDNLRAVLAITKGPLTNAKWKEFKRKLAGDSKGLRMEFVARR